MKYGDKRVSTLFAHTCDGCLLPLLTAIIVLGAESALTCQQEALIFLVQFNTAQKKINCFMMCV